MYRSAHGTKHFGYQTTSQDVRTAAAGVRSSPGRSSPSLQRSPVKKDYHSSEGRHRRHHGRSATSSKNPRSNDGGLLIDLSDDTAATCSMSASKSRSKVSSESSSNADVLSLLDGSIAEKYGCLPVPLGEKHSGTYDPFEVSAELKGLSSLSATPQHSAASSTLQPVTSSRSPCLSSSSFDSFSSQSTVDDSPTAHTRPPQTAAQRDWMRSGRGNDDVDDDCGTMPRVNSLTNLPIYGNLSNVQNADKSLFRSYCQSSSVVGESASKSRSKAQGSRSSNRSQRREQDSSADLNANSSPGSPLDWLESAISKNLSLVKNNSINNVDPLANGAGHKSTSMSAVWDEKNLSKGLAAARKKVPSSGSTFYVREDSGVQRGTRAESKFEPPPIPPRDHANRHQVEPAAHSTYANINDDQQTARQTATPLVTSSDIYQNFEEFGDSTSDASVKSVSHSRLERVNSENGSSSRRVRAQPSFIAATSGGEVERAAGASGRSGVDRVHHRVPSASRDDCRIALAACNNDVKSAAQHLKVDQLARLDIAPRDRCRTLLEACNWNLESAGSMLLHQLSNGSSV